MLIDAHHHVWRLSRGDYGWLTPELPIFRDYALDDLRPQLNDIATTVLVQAAPTEAETEFLLETARGSSGLVRGVVGWTNLATVGAADRVASLASEPLLKGLRPMLQDIAEIEWILRPDIRPALRAMESTGLRFDALIQPRHLRTVLPLCERHPNLRVVIDHAAKPDIARDTFEPWASDIARIAAETPAFCKLSGLVTEAGPEWQVDDLRPYVDHLLRVFGPRRLLWGSDWPVVDLAGGYARWRAATHLLLSGLDAPDRAMILGETATDFYGLT